VTITRRELFGLAAAALGTPALSRANSGPTAAFGVRIDAARLQQNLEELSVFGRPTGGTFSGGVSRVAYRTPTLPVASSLWN
jgi:hypothetical protein